jgi:hypothetical protein
VFSAAGTQSWVADRDYSFLGAYFNAGAGQALITTDKTLVLADFQSAGTTKLLSRDFVYYIVGAVSRDNPQLKIPIIADSTLFVTVAGQSSVVMYLDEIT